jgi:hypothetical protein
MKAYVGVDVYIHIFLTSALAGDELSVSRPGPFSPAEGAPSTHRTAGWVDPRGSLDDVEMRKFLTLPWRYGIKIFISKLSKNRPRNKIPM